MRFFLSSGISSKFGSKLISQSLSASTSLSVYGSSNHCFFLKHGMCKDSRSSLSLCFFFLLPPINILSCSCCFVDAIEYGWSEASNSSSMTTSLLHDELHSCSPCSTFGTLLNVLKQGILIGQDNQNFRA